MNQTVLSHHGVLGMKWGVRKDKTRLDVNNPNNVKNIGKHKGPMYHVSPQNLDNQTLTPRIPNNFLVKNGYENSETPRVSFTPDVGKSLMALSQNIKEKQFYVYEPANQEKYDVFKPNIIAVPDSSLTNELWIREPVKLRLVGKVTVGEALDKPLSYQFGENTAEIYQWNYSWNDDLKHYREAIAEDFLMHHGILGMKWGRRRYQNEDGSLTPRGRARLDKKDSKWAETKGEKIRVKVQKTVSKDMNKFVEAQLELSYTPTGKLSSKTILQYNNKMASLMNDRVSGIQAPSGRVLRFVAKRGEIGVHTAVADAGYNLDNLKKGVFKTGKVAYKKENLMRGGG